MIKLPKFPRKWRRSLAIIALLGLLAAGPGAYLLLHHPNQAEAAWFDSRWGFRQAITLTISSSASNISNLQTLLTINTSALISAGKLQSSCQDLRFTSVAGVNLPYYLDSGCNTTTTKVWVQADVVPKNTTRYVLYMYYGNNSAVAGSDQSTTYNFNLVKGLIGYWTMNDASWVNDCSTATVTDSSVNGNHALSCLSSSGLTGGVAGQFGNGAILNGSNQYINVTNNTALTNLTGDLTFSMWLKPGTTQNQYADIFSKHSPGSYFLEQNSFTTNQYYFGWDTSGGGAYSCTGTLINLTASVWQHLVISKSGATVTYYINGTSVASCTGSSATIVNNNKPLLFGAWALNATRNWNGSMDDFRIYNRALTDVETTQLYNYTGSILSTTPATIVASTAFATEEVGTSPLVYYKFDEGTSTLAHNSGLGGSTWAGTLTNMSSPPATNSGWMTEDQCVSGKCLRFNGANNYVITSALQGPQSGMSISTWVNPNSVTGTQVLAAQYNGTNAYMQLYETNGVITFRIQQAMDTIYIGRSTAAILAANRWQHIEATWTGGTTSASITIYVNGVQADLSNSQLGSFTAPYSGNVALTIGAQSVAASPFNGTIDEFKMYTYARSLAQVKMDFNLLANKVGALPQSPLDNGLVGYWKMDEASWNGTVGEVSDSSGTGNNGTGGASVTTGAGKFGLGGVFNGTTQYVSVANNSTLNMSTNITAAAWVYPTTISGAAEIINKKTDAGLSGYRLRRSGATIIFEYSDGVTARIAVTSAIKLVANQWQHVAATYDGQKVRIFYNGAQVYEEVHTSAMVTNSSTLYLGAYNALSAYWWAGSLDEVRLYNRALAPAEITQLYNFAPGPVGYWKFEQASWNGTAGEVLDSSGHNENGTAVCFTTGCTIPTTTPYGKYGRGAAVTNVDSTHVGYLTVADTGANDSLRMNGTAGLTLGAWVNIPNLASGGGSTQNFIVSKYNFGSHLGYALEVNTDGSITFDINGGANSVNSPAGTILAGNWYYIAAVFSNGTTMQIYVNGVLKLNTTIASTTLSAYTSTMGIGSASDVLGSNLYSTQATIDELKVYNYARTQAQIQDDMRGTNSSNPELSLLSGSATSSARLQSSSAMGYFKLNEGFGTLVNNSGSAGSTMSGTLTNFASPATSTSGWQSAASGVCKIGKCLAFNGSNNYVTITDNSSFANSSGDLTFSAWVKPTALDSANHDILFKAVNSTTSLRNYGLRLSNGNLWQALFYVGGSEITVTAAGITPSTTAWTHLVGVRSGSTGYLYVNGVLAGSSSVTGNLNTNSSSLVLGNLPGASEYFSGLVQEVKIFNFALNQDQINSDYNYGSSLTEGGVLGTSEASNDLLDTAGVVPVVYYNFNENTGSTVNDASGNGITGTWSGSGTQHWAPGKMGAAGKFIGGDDYVNATATTPINNLVIMTVEAWIKPADWGGGTIGRIADKGSSEGTGWGFSIANDGGTLYNPGSLAFYRKFSVTDGYFSSPASSISLNSWTHVAVVYNDGSSANTPTFYINGVKQVTTVNTNPSGTAANDTTSPFKIGNRQDLIRGFNGLIDEVKIYNYARTQAQIAYDYNRGGPTAWYKFDECQGTTLYDSSGNNNPATLTIGASGTQTSPGTCKTSSTAWGNGATGKINTSLNFDGTDDYVDIPSTTANNFTSSFGMSAWVKFSANSADQYILEKGTAAGTAQYYLWWNNTATTPNHALFCGFNSHDHSYVWTPTVGQWYHLSCTFDSTRQLLNIYINGQLVLTQTETNTPPADTGTIKVAKSRNSTNYFNGQLDDLRFFNYALSANQINKIFNNGAFSYGPTSGSP